MQTPRMHMVIAHAYEREEEWGVLYEFLPCQNIPSNKGFSMELM